MHRADWPAAATRFLALRLTPGEDLRRAIEQAFAAAPEEAGLIVAAVGSLSQASLRHAGRDQASVSDRAYELVSLSGTLSVDGPHLHAVLSGEDGAVTGGHVLEGCIVRTTAELVLALVDGTRFTRPVDPVTGCHELSFDRPDPKRT